MPQIKLTNQTLERLNELARNCFVNYRLVGGENHGKVKKLLDREILKTAWLSDTYGNEFENIFGIYMETQEYEKLFKKINQC